MTKFNLMPFMISAALVLASATYLQSSGMRPLRREQANSNLQTNLVFVKVQSLNDLEKRSRPGGIARQAQRSFHKVSTVKKNDPQAWYNLGKTYQQQENYSLAASAFLTAARYSDKKVYYYSAALAMYRDGQIHRSLGLLHQLVRSHPKDEKIWKVMGLCYEALEQNYHARICYQKAILLNPLNGEAVFYLERLPESEKVEVDFESPLRVAGERVHRHQSRVSKQSSHELLSEGKGTEISRANPIPFPEILKNEGAYGYSTKSMTQLNLKMPLDKVYDLSSDATHRPIVEKVIHQTRVRRFIPAPRRTKVRASPRQKLSPLSMRKKTSQPSDTNFELDDL